jgi:4-amino-4-deoxy-L-arabinose transferase-like glycosyltransferase
MITVLQTLRNRFLPHWLFLIYLAVSSFLYFSGVDQVPFHPDESTQIYMSSDGMDLFLNIYALSINPEEKLNQKQVYRLLDAPLTRYLIGISYHLTGNLPLKTDWDWSRTWFENLKAGALPSSNELWTARMSVAVFFPATLFLIYCLGNVIDGKLAGFSSAFFLGTNALVLLHTRRAMAEGLLLFGSTALLVAMLLAPKKIWLMGIAAAVAISSKFSSLGLLPVCMLALVWDEKPLKNRISSLWTRIFVFIGIFLSVTLLLNPAYWHSPVKTFELAFQLRRNLIAQQINEIGTHSPEQVLASKIDRLSILMANLYLTSPMVYEIGNYRKELAGETESYLAHPLNQASHNLVNAGLLMFFSINGLLWSVGQVLTKGEAKKRMCTLLVLGFLFETTALVLFVPLPWQRYVIPLVPMTAVFSGIGVSRILKTTRRIFSGGKLLQS